VSPFLLEILATSVNVEAALVKAHSPLFFSILIVSSAGFGSGVGCFLFQSA
jgi:hypothetical protein